MFSTMKKIAVVIDTNAFVNPDARSMFGNTPTESFRKFLLLLKEHQAQVECFIPPSVMEELLSFIEQPRVEKELFFHITRVSPERYTLTTPSLFFYELVDDIRNRVNKGLRVAEKFTRKALQHKTTEDELIKGLREEFKVALREGIIDSAQDVDLILLAYQLKASLLTTDAGLIKWADKLGIPCITTQEFMHLIKE